MNEATEQQLSTQTDLTTKWQERVFGWSDSGLSKSAYCKREGMNYHQMIYCSRKLCPENSNSIRTGRPKSHSLVPNGFVAVSVNPGLTGRSMVTICC